MNTVTDDDRYPQTLQIIYKSDWTMCFQGSITPIAQRQVYDT